MKEKLEILEGTIEELKEAFARLPGRVVSVGITFRHSRQTRNGPWESVYNLVVAYVPTHERS